MIIHLIAGLAAGCTLFFLKSCFCRARYPPGPKPLPVVGNIFDMPRSYPWETVKKWGETYGDLIHVRNFSDHTVFVNSYDIATELLGRRGAKYSSRPRMVMCNELQGWGYLFQFMPSGEDHRRSRRIFLNSFIPSALGQYNALLTKEVHTTLLKILQTPEQFFKHMRHLSGATIMMITYGYKVEAEKDPYIDLAEHAMDTALTAALGFFVVDYAPILKYLPDWFPGAGFKRLAKAGRKLASDTLNLPYAMAKELALSGQSVPSIISDMLEKNTNKQGEVLHEELIKAITSSTYLGGAETTTSSNLSFILAMVLYPEVQRRAQEELERVVGKGNLPTFDDLDSLPYVNAIYYEILRWHPVAPFAMSHCTTEVDIYDGYLIPTNTTVLANIWAMTRDHAEYPEPDLFKPERFLPREGTTLPRNPELIAFGFGRRICPGRHFAAKVIKLTIASCLAVFNIDKAIGEDGLPITPPEDYFSHAASHPKPFRCKITPRSPETETLLTRLVDAEK